ncbi:MAG TPA: hypothetical protein VLK85_04865, partial [Ramlibacter sp.]|nr:hypothetical protein [Ramlibacter sp.]
MTTELAQRPSTRAGGEQARPRLAGEAGKLLLRAAAPERRHLLRGVAFLLLAAGLEALGPLIGK